MALFWRGPLTFGFFALLLVVVAMTFAILAVVIPLPVESRRARHRFSGT
jgi:hypothetical protein